MSKQLTKVRHTDSVDDMNVAAEIRKWRSENGYSQAEAAEALDVSVRTLQNWEIGHRNPRGLVLRMLRQSFTKKRKTRRK